MTLMEANVADCGGKSFAWKHIWPLKLDSEGFLESETLVYWLENKFAGELNLKRLLSVVKLIVFVWAEFNTPIRVTEG